MLRALIPVCTAWIFGAALHAAPPERGFFSKSPARTWEQALVSGNGTHGAMVFGEPEQETVIINHGRLYLPLHQPLPPPDTASILPEIRRLLAAGDYQKSSELVVDLAKRSGYSGKHWTDPFIPACDMQIRMPSSGKRNQYQRSVDFATGVTEVTWADSRGRFSRRLFVSRTDDVIVMSIRGPSAGSVDCEFALNSRPAGNSRSFQSGIRATASSAADGVLGYRMDFARTWPGGLHACEVTARVMPHGGTSTAADGIIRVRGADEVLVLLRVDLIRQPNHSARAETAAALAKLPQDFDRLLAPHAARHGGMFLRSKLTLQGSHGRDLASEDLIASSKVGSTNPALLEKLYDAARYNILSSSGTVMPNLQGIWTGTWDSPWSGDFTMNGNLQTAMSANLSANLAECLDPYWRFLEENMPAFRENAKRLFGARGIHVPSRASTHGFNNHFCATWPMTFWTAGAPWAAQFLYDAWLYNGDEGFLRERVLPFMMEAAWFYEDFLIPGPDGKLLFSPSYSPENQPSNSPSQACVNATMDISAARELLTHLVGVCEKLRIQPEGVVRWKALLENLPPAQINADGALKEWTTPQLEDNYTHRHCSHLYAIYHGMPEEIAANPKLVEAYRAALEKRLEVRRQEANGISLNGRYAGEMAFGLALEAMAAASLREADDCAQIVDWLANRYWGPNLVSTHDPGRFFNTDISGGFPAVILRMLVDSQPGRLNLLPSVPADWFEGRIDGIRARGNIEIRSLEWSRNRVKAVLRSEKAQEIRVQTGTGTTTQNLTLRAAADVTFEADR